MLHEKVQDTLQMCEVDFSFTENKKDFSAQNIQLTLNTLLKQSFAFKMEERDMDLALGALNAGIEMMGLTQNGETAQKQFSLKKYTLSQYLRLDVAALKALNVFPQTSSTSYDTSVSG